MSPGNQLHKKANTPKTSPQLQFLTFLKQYTFISPTYLTFYCTRATETGHGAQKTTTLSQNFRPPFLKWRHQKGRPFWGETTYRFFLLLHTSGHLRHCPVDGAVFRQVWQVHGIVDRQWLGGIKSPRPERELTHGRPKPLVGPRKGR